MAIKTDITEQSFIYTVTLLPQNQDGEKEFWFTVWENSKQSSIPRLKMADKKKAMFRLYQDIHKFLKSWLIQYHPPF